MYSQDQIDRRLKTLFYYLNDPLSRHILNHIVPLEAIQGSHHEPLSLLDHAKNLREGMNASVAVVTVTNQNGSRSVMVQEDQVQNEQVLNDQNPILPIRPQERIPLILGNYSNHEPPIRIGSRFGFFSRLMDILNDLEQNISENGEEKQVPLPLEIKNNLVIKKDIQGECSICQGEITKDEESLSLSCKHVFHKDCIFPWFDRSSKCPNCRNEIRIEYDAPFLDSDQEDVIHPCEHSKLQE